MGGHPRLAPGYRFEKINRYLFRFHLSSGNRPLWTGQKVGFRRALRPLLSGELRYDDLYERYKRQRRVSGL